MPVRIVQVGSPSNDPWSTRSLLLRVVANATGLFLASEIVPGIEIGDWQSLVAGTAIFAIVNTLLRPLAFVLSFCLIVLTFGLFVIVLNAAMLGITAWVAGQLELSFEVAGFWSAVGGALVISLVALAATMITGGARARQL